MNGAPMTAFNRILSRAVRVTAEAVPTVIGIVILNFALLQLAPGDAADVLAAEAGSATVETMAELRTRFGLDLPVLEQLLNYLNNLAHFSLGYSPRYGMPVAELIGQRLPGTLVLMGTALAIAVIAGLIIGSVMAVYSGTVIDRILSIGSLIFYSVPGFWIGLMLILTFSVKLGWLPSGGSATIGSNLKGFSAVLDQARFIILPAISLALYYLSIYARLTRAAMLEVKSQDYIRTARAKGVSPVRLTIRHILRNALIPITTLAGMHIGGLLGGAVVVETVFSWPGLGRLAFEAVMARDFSVLLGILLLSAFIVILVNAAVDLLQAWLDPRIGDAR